METSVVSVDNTQVQEVARATSMSIQQYVTSHRSSVGRMLRGAFEIRTLEQAEKLSAMLATHCPDPEKVAVGIWELMSNAIEHGNLEIKLDEKTALLRRGAFADEVARRLSLPQYIDRQVLVEFERTKTAIHVRISDDGAGFEFADFLNAEGVAGRPNGLGIFIANKMCFDRLVYHGCGNQVEAFIET